MNKLIASDMRPLDELDVQVWELYWTEIARRIRPVFPRSDQHAQATSYLRGLLSPIERKNAWQLAEIAGDPNPYALQHLLGRAVWQADQLRDCLRSYLLDYLAAPEAVGVLDETGFLKKGCHSVGVARQYSGTAGRVENCQIGVFLSYASPLGHNLLDRELYLPKSWTDDPARCAKLGVPAEREFATKPELARQILERTFEAKVRLAWVAGDCIYGDDRGLRHWMEARQQPYVLGISSTEQLWVGPICYTHKELLELAEELAWERHSCGEGSQGPRWFEWKRLELNPPEQAGFKRWVVIRRSCSDPSEVSFYRAFGPEESSLAEQAGVVGTRWKVEESIQVAKGEVGLDHYEVRSWQGWYRHMTLASWAQAFLSVIRKERGACGAAKKGAVRLGRASSLADFKRYRGLRSD